MTGRAALQEVAQTRLVVPARRGLNREEAAEYVGIGSTMFDELVREGKMPGPVFIRSRKVWDIRALDMAFDRLSGQDAGSNPWDD